MIIKKIIIKKRVIKISKSNKKGNNIKVIKISYSNKKVI